MEDMGCGSVISVDGISTVAGVADGSSIGMVTAGGDVC